MARLNIEDCWWTDPRRSKLIRLIGDEDKADGIAVRAWRIAQEFWGKGRELVPKKVWETIEANSKLVEANLAEVVGDSVYVSGSSQYLDWIREKRESGRKGGLKSGEVRRKKNSDDQPKGHNSSKQTRSRLKQTQPSGSGSISDSLVVVGETTTTIPEIKKPSPSDNFANSFGPEADKLREFFNSQEILKDMKLFVPQIIHRWTTFDLFMVFYDGILGSVKFPKDKPGRKRYLMAAIQDEIGNSRKASQ